MDSCECLRDFTTNRAIVRASGVGDSESDESHEHDLESVHFYSSPFPLEYSFVIVCDFFRVCMFLLCVGLCVCDKRL